MLWEPEFTGLLSVLFEYQPPNTPPESQIVSEATRLLQKSRREIYFPCQIARAGLHLI